MTLPVRNAPTTCALPGALINAQKAATIPTHADNLRIGPPKPEVGGLTHDFRLLPIGFSRVYHEDYRRRSRRPRSNSDMGYGGLETIVLNLQFVGPRGPSVRPNREPD